MVPRQLVSAGTKEKKTLEQCEKQIKTNMKLDPYHALHKNLGSVKCYREKYF